MDVAGVALAFAAGVFFLWLARRPPELGQGSSRRRRLAANGLRLLYLFSGVSLLVRGAVALSMVGR
jgi:hypothetical protein